MRISVVRLVSGLLRFILMTNQEELIKELKILQDKMIEMGGNKPPPDPKFYYTEYGTVVYENGYSWF